MEIVLGREKKLPLENKRVIIAIVEPGDTEKNAIYQEGRYKKWLDRGELKYPDGYVEQWEKLGQWVLEKENTILFLNPLKDCSMSAKLGKYFNIILPPTKYISCDFPTIHDDFFLEGFEPKDILVFACGEFALGCVTRKLYPFNTQFRIPKKNLFVAHNFSVTPIPKDKKCHAEYLHEVGTHHKEIGLGRHYAFNTFQSVYLNLKEDSYSEYTVKE